MVKGMDENEIDEVHGEGPNLVIELDARTCVVLRCSAYTLQLSIGNALKEQRSSNLISTKRRVAKKVMHTECWHPSEKNGAQGGHCLLSNTLAFNTRNAGVAFFLELLQGCVTNP